MSFQGEIASFPLSDVVQNLAANRKSGTLVIRTGDVVRYVQFREGNIVSYTDTCGFSIAKWLGDKEIVPGDELEAALKRWRRARRKSLGAILRDLGSLDYEEYVRYYRELVKETLCEVLSLREGSFRFEEDNLNPKFADREAVAVGLVLQPQAVLMEAARQMDDWDRIRRHIPSENEIYIVPPAERERVLSECEDELTREAVELMDGSLTVGEVIAKLPASRFDASSVVAELIAEKRAKPLDGSRVVEDTARGEDPRQTVARLRTVLEREPGNRRILAALARLHAELGERDEGATCHKLLALSYLEEGDLEHAETELRKAIALNRRDLTSWQKLREVLRRQGDRGKLLLLTREFTAHFKKLGLAEVCREHLEEAVKLFPDEVGLRLELAEARYTLGDRKGAVEVLGETASELLRRNRWRDAESVLERLLEYDRNNKKARETYEKLRSGLLARRRALRRRLIRTAVLSVLAAACVGFVAYEFKVRGELFQVTRTVFAESLIEEGRYDEAIARIEAVRRRHPWTVLAAREAALLADILREKKALYALPPRWKRAQAPAGGTADTPQGGPSADARGGAHGGRAGGRGAGGEGSDRTAPEEGASRLRNPEKP